MNTISDSHSSLRVLAGLACFVVVVAGIREVIGIITDVMVAIFVAISCAPLLNWSIKNPLPVLRPVFSLRSSYLQSVLTFRCYGECLHFSFF